MPGTKLPAEPAQYRKALLFALALAAPGVQAMQAAPQTRPVMDTTSCGRPVYPEEDARQKNAGTVTMQFLLGPDGRVIDTKIQKSSGFRSLDEAARSALAKCRFRPPMVDGKPVQAWTGIQYVWTPE